MNTTHKKLQSAMEYLMTYGWAILIIAVVIGVLYALGIFNGSGFLGSFCTAQTGYFCANPILSTNSPTLNVTIGQDTRLEWPAWKIFAVRGTAFNASSPNITGLGAFYNGEKQIVTIPLNSILGNYIPIGTPLSGSLWAEYCNTPNCITPDHVSEIGIFSTKAAKLGYVTTSVSTTSLSTTSTTSTSTTSTSTTSTATTAPTTTITPSGIIYSVPITLTNSQSSNTPSPFQQMVNISESAYSQYLTYNGNFANFEYFTLSGNTVNVLPEWIESNNSGKLITWVKLPNGIPAKSNTIIYLGFASKSSNLLSSSGTTGIGEAPQLPCGSTPTSSCSTYAEYDDGANVFNNYWNFAGTTLPSGWINSNINYIVNNGITATGDSAGTSILYYETTAVPSNILEGYGNLYEPNTNWVWMGFTNPFVYSAQIDFGTGDGTGPNQLPGGTYMGQKYNGATQASPTVTGGQSAVNTNQIWSVAYISASAANFYSNYITIGTLTSPTLTEPVDLYIFFISANDAPYTLTYPAFMQWYRTRAYPPNGVMPSTTFGIVQGGSPSVTVSPSSVSLLPGTSFTLTANVSNGTSPYTYQWYNDTTGTGIPIAGKTSSTYTATAGSAAGTFEYYVKVTDAEPKTVQSLNSVVTVSSPPSGVTYYVPITLTNSQSSNTPSPFQQMVNISESSFSSYLTYNGNFANFEYFSSSGIVLPAWIESNNSGKLTTWVKLSDGIPAKSSITIYLGFASTSSNLLSSSGTTEIGEAPQLPCGSTPTSSCSTYAEYDDGAGVFNNYWNFAGTTLPSGWIDNNINYVVDNGLTATSDSGAQSSLYYGTTAEPGNILEGYGNLYEPNTNWVWLGFGNPTSYTSQIDFGTGDGNSGYLAGTYLGQQYDFSSGTDTRTGGQTTPNENQVWSVAYITQSSSAFYSNYLQIGSTLTNPTLSNPVYPYIIRMGANNVAYTLTQPAFMQWARVRTYPPNGVMPSASFGTVQGGSPSVTVSPSSVSLLPGTSFTLTADVSNGTSPYTYQWYNDTTGTGIPIVGETSSTYTATSGPTAGTFEYYVKVTDSESKTVQSLNSVVTVSSPPSGVTYYVPITITNSQSSNTPSPFQQMVNITENSTIDNYLTYNGNFANFEYYTLNGNTVNVLPGWIESNSSGKLITWVKLPNGIPADSNTIIYLGFASNTVNLLSPSGTTGIGEAPQLSSTYGQYDDGANVFLAYGAFQGGSLPSGWSLAGSGSFNGGNNGVYLSGYNSWGDVYTSVSNLPSNTIIETSYNLGGPSDDVSDYIVQGSNVYVYSAPYNLPASSTTTGILSDYEFYSGYGGEPSIQYYKSSTSISGLKGGTYSIGGNTYFYTQTIRSNNSVILDFYKSSSMVKSPVYSSWTGILNYTGPLPISLPTSGTFGIFSWEGTPLSGPGPNYVLWTRMRTEPPDNIMPSVTFG